MSSRNFSSAAKALNLNTINKSLKEMEYAVRGLVPMRADTISAELSKNPKSFPFKEVLYCNIGNPQSVSQPAISFYRDVIALCEVPRLIKKAKQDPSLFDKYAIQRAEESLALLSVGTGAYTHSQGNLGFRKHVSEFIFSRDGFSSNPEDIFLTNGASSGIQMLLNAIISDEKSGIMVPVPQYPIYSALTRLLNGKFVGYYLNEQDSWGLDLINLQESINKSRSEGTQPKAIVIINPGNPTGNVLTSSDLKALIKFCKKEKLVLISDEVYQENIYSDDSNRKFHSAKKVLMEMGPEYATVELASFHSTSKGMIGECGKRGGYMELVNFDPEVKAQLVKLASSGLCSNTVGQIVTSLMVKPPPQNSDSFPKFMQEKLEIFNSLKRKAKLTHDKLNSIKGVSCQPLDGAMYAFPKLDLSQKFIREAEKLGRHPDTHYALTLLENTGLCSVPGNGFNQREGTFHLRLTILPEEEKLAAALDSFAQHHKKVN